MSSDDRVQKGMARGPCASPAEPLWRLAPTRGEDGRSLADFMMLIPGLADRPALCRQQVTAAVRKVCESYGDRVAFADINYSINVLWVSVAADPGLAGRVAQAIREKVPEALLVGGQLGVASALKVAPRRRTVWWRRMHLLSKGAVRRLIGPGR